MARKLCPICEKRFSGYWSEHRCNPKVLRHIDAMHRNATDGDPDDFDECDTIEDPDDCGGGCTDGVCNPGFAERLEDGFKMIGLD